MIYRKLDANKDYTLGRGAATVISGTDAVAQAVYTRLKLWQEEWWENIDEGLPVLQQILGYRYTQKAADILIRARILETTDIVNIISFSSTFDNETRAYSCSAEVATKYGQVNLLEVTF